ncbi:uncharacterized protein LOC126676635 [Mercurialis annua]|uniref:uncharacterized protein LOC126676635 n=1 Tax=Mercurialis annua TaxID=3986 RepID=UPI002160FACE|nr:uncharacterized protein LOC126676635 [Mercurialis annua]
MIEADKHLFHHFSHQHPLERTVSPSTDGITCYGCSLGILPENDYHQCKTCSFSLHSICSKIPRKIKHPAHPNHYLTLLVSPTTANSSCNCEACGDNVSGFYYNCAECDIYFHILCSFLPLSVPISSHHHTLNIEFSPPYDFCCDLCDKPNHLGGWLYRCRFCEFDAHISCAISDQRIQSLLLPNTLTRQNILFSGSDFRIDSQELMQLVLQGVLRSNQDGNIGESGIGKFPSDQAEMQMSNTSTSPLDQTRNKDSVTTSISEDLTMPSYQFSDLCFSIDILKSYSSQDQECQENKQASNKEMEKIIPEGEANANPDTAKMLKKHVFNPLYLVNEEFSFGGANGKLGQHQEIGKDNKNGVRPIEYNGIKSKKQNSMGSFWMKLFSCWYDPGYQKCSNSFKNGGM